MGAGWPDLSRDGRRLAWVDSGRLGILVGTAEGRRSRRIVRSGLGLGGPIMPRWAPSGRAIAFAQDVPPPRDRAASFSQIFVIGLGDGRARRLETVASMIYPSWSPDGRRVVPREKPSVERRLISARAWVVALFTAGTGLGGLARS